MAMRQSLTRRTLISFVGARDPLNAGGADGPILSLLRARRFGRVYLLHNNEPFRRRAEETKERIEAQRLCEEVHLLDCRVGNPTDYGELYLAMLDCVLRIAEIEGKGAKLSVNVASGTPQMETCWVLLRQSGLLVATLLRPTDPRHSGSPPVVELTLEIDDFPQITAPDSVKRHLTRLSRRVRQLEAERAALDEDEAWGALIGDAPAFREAIDVAKALAQYDVPVVITGETGTGKELVARALHFGGPRRSGPFIEVNCAALPDDLVEMELFGHTKGAFTDAREDRPGRFELADGGTLFLDELAEMSEPAQRKLLRVVETGQVERLGESKPRPVNVRLVAATNRDPEVAIQGGALRADLWYRLSVGQVRLPPLRDRRDDIALLAHDLARAACHRHGVEKTLDESAFAELERRNWPGNVRELRNVVERLCLLAPGERIGAEGVQRLAPTRASEGTAGPSLSMPAVGVDLRAEQARQELEHYRAALEASDGNCAAAARLLGIKPNSFRKRARALGLAR